MKIKKIDMTGNGDYSLAIFNNGDWIVLKTLPEFCSNSKVCDDLVTFLQNKSQFEDKLYQVLKNTDLSNCIQTKEMKEVMPFKPLFYRDFMLCENHVINSSRGFVKYTMPKLLPIIKTYEAILKKPFPGLKPKRAWYNDPVYYKGNILSFVGDGETIYYPKYATLLDYELELGMLITKDLLNATEQEGLDAIGAFCVFNDFSVRNVQYEEMKETGFGPCKAKDFASSISNVVVTADEILPYLESIKVRVIINDNIVAEGQMDSFYHSIGKAVAYASKGENVYAGEFMGTGTIPNCSAMENDAFLSKGDVIRLEIDKIGSVTNTIGDVLI